MTESAGGPIIITLHGEPRGKGRPRSRIAYGKAKQPFVAVYTDASTRAYERALALAGRVAMRSRPPLTEPLSVAVTAIMSVPASWSQKKRAAALAGELSPTGRPDVDNIFKSVDALNGIVWADDKQIVCAIIEKRYGAEPMLRIEVGSAR